MIFLKTKKTNSFLLPLIFILETIFLPTNVFATESKVAILENTNLMPINEAEYLKNFFEKNFKSKSPNANEINYFIKKQYGDKADNLFSLGESVYKNIDDIVFTYIITSQQIFKSNIFATEPYIFATYMCNKENADFLIIPLSLQGEENTYLSLWGYSNAENSFYQIYSKAVPTNKISDYLDEFSLSAYIFLSDKEKSIVHFENKDYGYISFLQDGCQIYNGSVINSGENTITIISPGRTEKTITQNFPSGEIVNVDFELSQIQAKDLTVTSFPKGATFSSLDKEISGTTPLKIDFYMLPLTYSITKDGYESKIGVLNEAKKSLDVSLKPIHLAGQKYSDLKAKKFYTSLTTTLCFFALNVLSKAIIEASPNDASPVFKVMEPLSKGISVFCVCVTVGELLKYFKSSSI